ncbi:hypothetical protein BV898_02889 [Hypsibius exemplaris]|uniref:Uncharacterized protein n=1 Tax=Hypsibius exemplaris TaxID=2072580 RepID=A0A1W0X6L6_HYPEX|nr:hypothetical protein BV898_02889 [Hypsibius exemplaris]
MAAAAAAIPTLQSHSDERRARREQQHAEKRRAEDLYSGLENHGKPYPVLNATRSTGETFNQKRPSGAGCPDTNKVLRRLSRPDVTA